MISTLRHLFTPHHTNNHRPRILHPAGLAILTAFTLLSHATTQLIELHPPQGLVLGYATNINSQEVIQFTNDHRSQLGLPPLNLNSQLSRAAEAKAHHMFSSNYWAHIAPDGTTPWQFIKDTGYRYSVAGENLARDFNDTATMIQAWMDSPTHRANIMHPKYEEIGIGIVNGKLDGVETTLVVQMFGKPAIPSTLPDTSPQISPQAQTTQTLTLDTNTPPAIADQSQAQTKGAILDSQSNSSVKLFISPLDIKKSVVLSVIGVVILVLLADELIINRKKTIRFVGRNWAHLSFLTVILLIIFTLTKPGGIL